MDKNKYISDKIAELIVQGKSQIEAMNLAYDEWNKEQPLQYLQQGGITQFKKKPFQLKDERGEVVRESTFIPKPTVERQLTPQEIEERRLALLAQKQGQLRSYTPQTTPSKVKEVALNPMTAFGYIARNEDLPDNFSRGERNLYDSAIDVINPAFYANQGKEAISNTGSAINNVEQGKLPSAYRDIKNAGMNALNFIPSVEEIGAGAKVLRNSELVNNLGNNYLPNAYKLNPRALTSESFNNPNSFYRQIDSPTFNEGVESGLIRGKQNVNTDSGEGIINLNKSFVDDAYYKKSSLYSPQRADYIYEVRKGEEFFTPKVNNRTRGYTTENTPIRVSTNPIPIDDAIVYKKDWWQGYKELPKQQNGGTIKYTEK